MADDRRRSTPQHLAGTVLRTGVSGPDLSLYAKGLTTAEISAHFCCLRRSRAAASASESGCSAGSAWCRTYDPVAGSPRRAGGAGWEIGAPMSDGARRALVTGASAGIGRACAGNCMRPAGPSRERAGAAGERACWPSGCCLSAPSRPRQRAAWESDGRISMGPAGPIAGGCLSSWPVRESASPGIAGQPNTSGRSERQRHYASRRDHSRAIGARRALHPVVHGWFVTFC